MKLHINKKLANVNVRLRICKSKTLFKLGFTPCKAEQPLPGTELKEKEAQKDYSIQKICLERTCS